MRIRSIELTDFRGVQHCRVEFPASGVTIIEGDNEVGKTSIDEAIRVVLTERDDTSKQAVRDLQPVGRDVGPRVVIEVDTGPYSFRCTKQFVRKTMTELDVTSPSREQLTGREAHDRMRAILAETMDESLWGALRMTQGAELHQPELGAGALGRALDRVAGGNRPGPDDSDGLWSRIVEERDRYFTSSGRARKPLKEAEEAVEVAQSRVRELEAELASLESDTEAVARLKDHERDLTRRRGENDEALRELVAQDEAIALRRTELDRLRAELETAGADHARALEAHEARLAAVEHLEATEAARAAIEHELAELTRSQSDDAVALEGALEAHEQAKIRLGAAENAHRSALADSEHLRQRDELEELRGRSAAIEEAVGRRQEALRALESNRVDSDALAAIEAAHDEVVKAEARASAGSPSVHLASPVDLDVEIAGETSALSATLEREVPVVGELVVELPGSLRVTVRAGSDAAEAAEALAEARERLESLCSGVGVPDVRAARKAARERVDTAAQVETLDVQIASALRGSTPEEIQHRIDLLVERVRCHPLERESSSALPGDLPAAELAAQEASSRLDDARRALDEAEVARERHRAAVSRIQVELAAAGARLDRATADLEGSLDALERARRTATDDELAGAVEAAAGVVELRRRAVDDATDGFDATAAEVLGERLENSRALQERLDRELARSHDELVALRSRLETRGEDGLAGQLDDARTELVRATGDRDRVQRRADAARLLHDTFAARREETRRRYVAPLRAGIERLGRIVFGPSFEVDLDEDLRVTSRTLDGVKVDHDQLSTGAKEQLGMILRLAAAEIVADDNEDSDSSTGGAPVVFDDALGWSDPERLRGMGAVLSTAARNCQVIVLTCTPGRYESVGNAEVVRLGGRAASPA